MPEYNVGYAAPLRVLADALAPLRDSAVTEDELMTAVS
jgi:hypothetical protein